MSFPNHVCPFCGYQEMFILPPHYELSLKALAMFVCFGCHKYFQLPAICALPYAPELIDKCYPVSWTQLHLF